MYGGTKEEMARLLKDAEALTGKKFDISNFADIVDAIHAIQVNMDVAGTTAKEASTTISGSWGSTKAAWDNLLVAMADPKGNIKKATANLVKSAKTTLTNVLPIIKQTLTGIGEFITDVAPMIGEYIPELLTEFIPKFISAGKDLAIGLGKGIVAGFKKIKWPTWSDVKSYAKKAWTGIQAGIENLGGLIFGKNEDGTVNWPNWESIKKFASDKWKQIVDHVKALPGLVFGKKEDGSVNWPDWAAVHDQAVQKWNEIVAKAGELGTEFATLVFGKTDKGEVAWPEWSDVVQGAKDAWSTITTAAAQLGEDFGALVFGKTDKGEVAWPTWDDVKQGALDVWNKNIVPSAAALGNEFGTLVFGKTDGGEVNWPTWQTVHDAAVVAWDNIVTSAGSLTDEFAKLIFGKTDKGEVAWPEWEDVEADAKIAWDSIVAAAASLGEGFATLVFGKNEKGEIAWPEWSDIQKTAAELWVKVQNFVGNLAGLVFGRKNDGSVNWPTWRTVRGKATEIWNSIKEGAAKFTGLKFGDAEGAADIFDTILASFTKLHDYVEQNVIDIAQNFFGDSDPATVANAVTSIGSALEAIGVAIITYFTVQKLQAAINFFKNLKTTLTSGLGANKVGLILSGIAAAITLLVENWDKIEPALQEFSGWFTENVWDPVQKFFEDVKQAIRDIGSFFGIDTSGWFRGNPQAPTGTGDDRKAAGYSNARLDMLQINSLIEAWNLRKQFPDARFKGTDGETRNATDNLKQVFEETLRAGGFDEGVIKQYTESLTSLSDEGFKDLVTSLGDAQGYFDEAGQKIGGFGDGVQVVTTSVGNLGTAAENAAEKLNSIHSGTGDDGSHAKGAWNIPYDNYRARLHREEMVLDASRARDYREGRDTRAGIDSTVVDAINELRATLSNLSIQVAGREFGRATVRYGGGMMNGYLGSSNRSKMTGYGTR